MPCRSGSPQGVFAGTYVFAALATGFDAGVCAIIGVIADTMNAIAIANRLIIGALLDSAHATPACICFNTFRRRIHSSTLSG